MRISFVLCATLAVLGASAASARAGVHDLRLGVVAHNVFDRHNREDSQNIEAEIVWETPGFLEFLGKPRPYLMISANDEGYTSFAAAGLYWRYQFADHWALEPGFGYAIHDGKLDTPHPGADPRNGDIGERRVLLGSRDLFRTTLALERDFGDRFATQIYLEHLSHGQILGHGRNQGLDEAGVRLVWRFKPE
jgi:lipid A 3-O-deacylase